MAATAGSSTVSDVDLKYGILGNGRIARTLLGAIDKIEGCHAVAIAARNPAQAEKTALECGLERGSTYQELIDDPGIDVIYNALPNSLHAEWTVKAANAGKHVLSEKPFAVTVAEADAMIEAAQRNKVVVMEAFMYRFHPIWGRVEELIRSGAIGHVRYVLAHFAFGMSDTGNIRFSKSLAGGAMMDVGCYCVNFTRYIADLVTPGATVERVSAESSYNVEADGTRGVDEATLGNLYFSNDMLAQFACSIRVPGGHLSRIVGEEGSIEIPSPWFAGAPAQLILTRSSGGPLTEGIAGGDQYALEVSHFNDCVCRGISPRITHENSRQNTAAVAAILQSAAEKQPVGLNR